MNLEDGVVYSIKGLRVWVTIGSHDFAQKSRRPKSLRS